MIRILGIYMDTGILPILIRVKKLFLQGMKCAQVSGVDWKDFQGPCRQSPR